MTPKYTFSSEKLKTGLSMSKLVKPVSNEYIIKFYNNRLSIFSSDKRRITLINIFPDRMENVDDDFVSNEYYIPVSKISLFDSKLDVVVFSVKDDSLVIKTNDDNKTRRATIKRKVDFSRRSVVPEVNVNNEFEADPVVFSKILKSVGCSALVRETKTEEEMRVNQVHFKHSKSFSNARYHASFVDLSEIDINLDLSIIGSDIPSIRSFCSKVDSLCISYDKHKLYIIDKSTNSYLVLGRVVSKTPDFSPPSDNFKTKVFVNKKHILDGLNWTLTAIDGTQRINCQVSSECMKIYNNKNEIFNTPIMYEGQEFSTDIPARFLCNIINHIDSENILIKFNNPDVENLVEVCGEDDSGTKHYFNTMRSR